METLTQSPHEALPKAVEIASHEAPHTPVVTQHRPVSVHLSVPRGQAAREIQNQFKIGEAIAYQRIRDRWSLDQARAEKQEWVQRTYDLLARLFNSTVVADRCNDWVARLLPEYAPLEDFVELFEVEMRHRLGRLQSVLKRLRDVPDVHQQTAVSRLQVSDPRAEVVPEATEAPVEPPAVEPDMTGQVTLREDEPAVAATTIAKPVEVPAKSVEPPAAAPVETPVPAPVEAKVVDETPVVVSAGPVVATPVVKPVADPQPVVFGRSEVVYSAPTFVMTLQSAGPGVYASDVGVAVESHVEPVPAVPVPTTTTSTQRGIRSSAARQAWTLGDFDPIL